MHTLFQYKSITQQIELTVERGVLNYKNFAFGKKENYNIPIHRSLDSNLNFSRVYHLGPLITSLYLGVLSIILVIKRWNSGQWTLYFGISIVAIIFIGYIYYFLKGIQYGEVELDVNNSKIPLYMTKFEYLGLKNKIDLINKTL